MKETTHTILSGGLKIHTYLWKALNFVGHLVNYLHPGMYSMWNNLEKISLGEISGNKKQNPGWH
jgi:hypothetical protein